MKPSDKLVRNADNSDLYCPSVLMCKEALTIVTILQLFLNINSIGHHCGISPILVPSTNIMTY